MNHVELRRQKMKKSMLFVAAVVSLIVFSQQAIGQEEKVDKNSGTNENKKWGLQFQIDKSTFLTAYNGTTLSIMRNINEKRAWRAGVSFNGNISDYLNEIDYLPGDSLVFSTDGKQNDYNFQLTIQYLFKKKISDNVSCYYGFGPNFLKSNANQKFKNVSDEPTIEYRGWGIGCTGVFGVEWFFQKQISLNAEYNTGFFYQRSKTIQKRIYPNYKIIDTQNLYSFISSPVRFGVSVFF
jgi:hypothetical protein